MTEKVRSELIGRGKWVVKPDATDVDGLISGDIVAISLAPAAFNAQQQATRYALTLTARVEFKDIRPTRCSGPIRRCSIARSSTSPR